MKITKVEISGFRAFNKSKDATFDFTLGEGDPANFVSIYAPNGFGKTSFYDAVEWCITNKINRFARMGVENEKHAKDDREYRKVESDLFLTNHHASADQQKFVKVTTDDLQKFERNIPQGTYNFQQKGEKNFFTDVILAQETIHGFLKEENPEDRYIKFVESFPQLNSFNEALHKLRVLIGLNQKEIENLDKMLNVLSEKQLSLSSYENNKSIEELNKVALILMQANEEIEPITKNNFNTSVFESLAAKITARITVLTADIEKIEGALSKLDATYNGAEESQNEIGVARFFNLTEELRISKEILRKRENYKRNKILTEQISENTKNLEKEMSSKQELSKIISRYKKFIQIKDSINKLIQNSKTILKNKRSEISTGIINMENAMDALDVKLNDYDSFINKINNNIQLAKHDNLAREFMNAINAIILNQELTASTEKELLSIQSEIDSHKSLNEELKNFVSKGIELINQDKLQQDHKCPLCTQLYDSHKELVDKIIGNDLLGEQLKELLAKKSGTEAELNKLRTVISENIILITEKTEDKAKPDRNQKDKLSEEVRHLRGIENQIILYAKEIENKTIESEESLTDLAEFSSGRTYQEVIDLSAQLKKNNHEIEKRKADDSYALVTKYLKSRNISIETPLSALETDIEEIDRQITNLQNKTSELKSERNKVASDSFIEGNVQENDGEIVRLKQEIDSKSRVVSNFEHLIQSNLDFDISGLSLQQVNSTFTSLKEMHRATIESKAEIIKNYTVIDNLKGDAFKIIELEKLNEEIINLLSTREKYNKVESVMEEEKKNLEDFLELKINAFFFEPLINQIYQKIEPHPDYKEIGFDCNFSEDKPRLQIYTVDRNGNKSIPGLYFSSAQINILSLSVFLARALNAKTEDGKPINCIFIDDPVQSMDSTNILSFIDLFRSLVVNFDKQIIISTHEENFHNLLQKKIPTNLFRSKFIEFETFGRLNKK